MKSWRHTWLVVLVATAAIAPRGARADEPADIARERAAVVERYAAGERACRGRFVVTSCVDEAKRERREALDRLKARQLVFDENRRRERADARRQSLAEKAADEARRDAERASRAGRQASSAAAASAAGAASGVTRAVSVPRTPSPGRARATPTVKPAEPAADRARREATSREAYRRRQRAAEVHRRESIDATLGRMAGKPTASSLPTSAPGPAVSAPR